MLALFIAPFVLWYRLGILFPKFAGETAFRDLLLIGDLAALLIIVIADFVIWNT